jgi:hypothetical protein
MTQAAGLPEAAHRLLSLFGGQNRVVRASLLALTSKGALPYKPRET